MKSKYQLDREKQIIDQEATKANTQKIIAEAKSLEISNEEKLSKTLTSYQKQDMLYLLMVQVTLTTIDEHIVGCEPTRKSLWTDEELELIKHRILKLSE